MELVPVKYERHIFVCVNEREEGDCCAKRNSSDILMALRNHINRNGLVHRYNVSKSKCLGHCAFGPTIAVYPDGLIFRRVNMEDTKEIIEKFLR
ncbi:MAG: (2Fe-2S) ferredoxin domain-containing protein [Candidatus Aenigmarchaeota archaeon]|nr:(2Fe-2S) ferredoxin domain-containing protein [Candidatus Aenigmarchaeota archaeon]